MSDFSIAGILRSPSYSPNHIGSDAAILTSVCASLRKRGCPVTIYSEAELMDGKVSEKIISHGFVSMLFRTYGVQLYLCHTSRRIGSLVSHAPCNIYPLLN